MHKDRDGLIKAGPVWDYNFSLNNASTEIEGWQWEDGRTGSNDWYDIMCRKGWPVERVVDWCIGEPVLIADQTLVKALKLF